MATIVTLFIRETGPLLKWDKGKKTVSVLVHSVLLPWRAKFGIYTLHNTHEVLYK